MSSNYRNDTIVAPATPPGYGGIGVIRLSGPLVKNIATHLFKKIPSPREAFFHLIKDEKGHALDEGIVLFFPEPHSFTGEDVLEFQGHGGPAVIHSILQRMIQLGARLARPGEFSERAFLNNKIDLTKAEAIADLIHASSEQAARAAVRSLQGEFSKQIHELVDILIRLRSYVEASIDFSEEEIDFLSEKNISKDINFLLEKLLKIQSEAKQGSLLRDGIVLVIAGEPNVGKSSLLNRLSGREVAIVTDVPGTTRDLLREHIHIDGMPLHIIDTAGLRESEDVVEQEGIRRARDEIAKSDIVLHLVDSRNSNTPNEFSNHSLVIMVRNKIDLTNEEPEIKTEKNKAIISLSAKTGEGIDLLTHHIKSVVGFHESSEGCFSARRRHMDALQRANEFLHASKEQLKNKRGELLAEDLRQAQLALNEITGEFTSDDLLGKIFSSFCIGK